MTLPRPAQSFDTFEEWDAWWNARADEVEGEAQAADDTCSEPEG